MPEKQECIDSGLACGGFWARLLAYFLDSCLLKPVKDISIGFIIFIPVAIGVFLLAASLDNTKMFLATFVLFMLLIVVCVLLASLAISSIYSGYFLSRHGSSPGKIVMEMVVVKADTGERLSFREGFAREFAKIFSILSLGIGFLMIAWDPKKRALHDIICGTLVLRRPSMSTKPQL